MPIFEYRCRECGERFEELVLGPAPEEPVECQHCHSRETEKLMSACATTGLGAAAEATACRGGGGFT